MAETQGDPRLVGCTNCNAKPGEPCTQPDDNGRHNVSWFHLAREASARVEVRAK